MMMSICVLFFIKNEFNENLLNENLYRIDIKLFNTIEKHVFNLHMNCYGKDFREYFLNYFKNNSFGFFCVLLVLLIIQVVSSFSKMDLKQLTLNLKLTLLINLFLITLSIIVNYY